MSLLREINLQSKALRRERRRYQQKRKFGLNSLASQPVLFCNSFPKSGTHLLTQILEGFISFAPVVNSGLPAVVTFEGASGNQRPHKKITKDLQRFKPGDIGYGHVHAFSESITWMKQKTVAPYFILRDPRDVVVSHCFYVTDIEPNHVHHDYYQSLGSFEERLKTSILGRPELVEAPFPDIYQRFLPYLEWTQLPQVCNLHFEYLIHNRHSSLDKILAHAEARGLNVTIPREEALDRLEKSIRPKDSPTFRSGQTGGWVKYFTPEIKALFKEVTAEMLIHMGYEKDMDW
ncbi:MAG: sulfotransferase domain-containing protein [Anaerolineales bacterium]|nr:sulfotransferase domain-containing protein [Anaerolineales bacterium]